MNGRRLHGVVERRLLVNYRVDPELLATMLPEPFRPMIVNGYAVAGTCLLGLRALRPHGVPSSLGMRLEGAAHRIAVEWDTPDGAATAVYIRRRETSSIPAVVAGGRIFPGRHHYATFAFSAARRATRLDGLRMTTETWPFEPTQLIEAESTFFDDARRFPPGTAQLDSAFLMREVAVTLEALPSMDVRPRDVTLQRVG